MHNLLNYKINEYTRKKAQNIDLFYFPHFTTCRIFKILLKVLGNFLNYNIIPPITLHYTMLSSSSLQFYRMAVTLHWCINILIIYLLITILVRSYTIKDRIHNISVC